MKTDKGFRRLTLVLSPWFGIVALLIYERPRLSWYVPDWEQTQIRTRVANADWAGEKALASCVAEYGHPELINKVRNKGLLGSEAVAAEIVLAIHRERRSYDLRRSYHLLSAAFWLAERGTRGVGGYVLAYLIGFVLTWAMYIFIRYAVYVFIRYVVYPSVRWIVRGFKGGTTPVAPRPPGSS